MEIGTKPPAVTMADVQQAAADAAKAVLPPFSDDVPRTEMTGGSAGKAAAAIPRQDHQHPRLTATASGTLRGDGTQVITFTRTFSSMPAVTVLEVSSANNSPPASFKVQSWTQDAGGLYVGCVISGSRARALPMLSALGVTALLSGVITGTNALISALTGFVPYEAAAGVQFTLIALEPTKAA